MLEDLNRTDRRYRDALTACAGIDTRIATAIVKCDYRSTLTLTQEEAATGPRSRHKLYEDAAFYKTLGEMLVNYAEYVEYAAKRNGRDGKRKD